MKTFILFLHIQISISSNITKDKKDDDDVKIVPVPSLKNIQKHIAFNCYLKDNLEYEEFSLMGVEPCKNTATQYKNPIQKKALIIKPRESLTIKVLQCSLIASFKISHCSYSYLTGYRIWDGDIVASHLQLHLSKSECVQAVRDQQLRYMDRTYYQKFDWLIIDLMKNGQANGWKTLRGSVNAREGSCSPDSFALLGEQYSSHVLQMKYKINIQWEDKSFNIKNRALRLNEHLIIDNTASGSYFDPTYGNFHWNNKDISNTSHQIWQEVLRGDVQLHISKDPTQTKSIAIIHFENNSIALTLESKESICIQRFHSCREAFKTASKGIYLILTNHTEVTWKLQKITVDNIDKLEEIKASATSIFLTNSLEIEESFTRISKNLCEKNRNLIVSDIKKYLSKLPDQERMNKELIQAGSVVYSTKCQEILVWLAPEKSKCYNEPRVGYLNDKTNIVTFAHIDPISHHLFPHSKEIHCDTILPYKIAMRTLDDNLEYYCRTKNGWSSTNCEQPKQLKPLSVGVLYKTNTKKIHTSLFDSNTAKLLDEQQWETNIENKNSEIMLKMFEELRSKTSNDDNVFDRMISEMRKEILQKPIKWLHKISEFILPTLSVTYILNVLIGITLVIPKYREKTKNKVLSVKHLTAFMVEVLKAIFPVFVNNNNHTCKCEEEMFLTEIAKEVENHERTRFLHNLMN